VEWQTPEWEWVDPQSEQAAAKDAIENFMSTYQTELGQRGKSWRSVFYQQSKERRLMEQLGLKTLQQQQVDVSAAQSSMSSSSASTDTLTSATTENVAASALNGAQVTSLVDVITQVGTGAMPKDTAKPVLQAAFPSFSQDLINSIIDPIEPGSIAADGVPAAAVDASDQSSSGVYMGLSTQQWNRNRKAIQKTLDELASGTMTEPTARVFLKSTGMPDEDIEILIKDALDGVVNTQLPTTEVPQ
jgi:hypothetical protein